MIEVADRPISWTQKEVTYLVKNFNVLPIKAIAYNLGRTIAAVHKKLKSLRKHGKIQVSLPRGSGWTPEEDQMLRQIFPEILNKNLPGKIPGRSETACVSRARLLGLRKSADLVQKFRGQAALMGGEANRIAIQTKRNPEKLSRFYGDKVGIAQVYLAEQRPRSLDRNNDKLVSPKVFVSGSTLLSF